MCKLRKNFYKKEITELRFSQKATVDRGRRFNSDMAYYFTFAVLVSSFLLSTIASQYAGNVQDRQGHHRSAPRQRAHHAPSKYPKIRQYPQKKQDPLPASWTDFVPQSPVSNFGAGDDSFFKFKDLTAGSDDLFNQIQLGPQTTHALLQNGQQPSYSITPVVQPQQQPPQQQQQGQQPQVHIERSQESKVTVTESHAPQQQQPQQPQFQQQQPVVVPVSPPGHYIQAAFLNPVPVEAQPYAQEPQITQAIQVMGPTTQVIPSSPPGAPPQDAEYVEYQKHLEAYNRYQEAVQGQRQGSQPQIGPDGQPQKVLMSIPYKKPVNRGPKGLPFPYNFMDTVVESFRGKSPTKPNPYPTKPGGPKYPQHSSPNPQYSQSGSFGFPPQAQTVTSSEIYSPFPSPQTPTGQQQGSGQGPTGQGPPTGPSLYPGQGPSGPSPYPGQGPPSGSSPYAGQGPSGPSPYGPQGSPPSGPSPYPGQVNEGPTPSPFPTETISASPYQVSGPSGSFSAKPQFQGPNYNELPQSPLPTYAFTGSPKFPSQWSPGPSPSTFTSSQTEIFGGKPVDVSNYPKFHSDVAGAYRGPPKGGPSFMAQWQQGVLMMAKDLIGSWIKPVTNSFQPFPPGGPPHVRNKRHYGLSPSMDLVQISKPENAIDPIPDDGKFENQQ